ncbi:hypothetical protein SAMN02745751_00029 [Dethiosulfatibacter aminovorans DSM 17477]|uniref:Serine aminopeptidase S33 domain-containing protein n=1 Tax=Dethiosulfatibacter aminovorans DSM 17477 TaxID=1121476 RepID=A0A1M6A9L0_9FIRM|nr:alpha/beta fold hydrolase [Dethiosulfatibacter aminovorans]SHI32843.1 hypothetical protein SAMN02745751_00029 [Dethiosulfatibacter aminovorans DSM 17477]
MKKPFLLLLCLIIVFSTSCKKDEPPEEMQEDIVADEKYAEETGNKYLKDLFNEKYEEAYNNYPHDSAMEDAVDPEKYKNIMDGVYKQQGEFKEFKGSETNIKGDYIIFTSGALFEYGALNVNVVFDKKGRLAGINFSEYTFGFDEPENLTDDQLVEMATAYLKDLLEGRYIDGYNKHPHSKQMEELLNPEEYEKMFAELKKTSGEFISFNGNEVTILGTYKSVAIGTLFEKQNYNMNVIFDSYGKIGGLNFTIYTFGEDEVPEGLREADVEFGLEDWKLTGKITLPKEEGVYPLLILVHGSGPNNMNETVGLNEPFKDIAYYLAEKGIAVLRYDKRTYTYQSSIVNLEEFTVYDETIDDAAEAVKFASSLDYIDSDNIFVLGHSLGAYLMPRIAEVTDDAGGYIMASGIYTSLADIVPYQYEYLVNLDGKVTEEEQKQLDEAIIQSHLMKNPDDIEEGEIIFGAYKAYWKDLAEYDPVALAEKIEKPVFVLQGDRDYQIPVSELELLQDTLSQKENFKFKVYEGLNHLLMFGTEKPTPQEYYVENTVYPPLLDDIIDFIMVNQ